MYMNIKIIIMEYLSTEDLLKRPKLYLEVLDKSDNSRYSFKTLKMYRKEFGFVIPTKEVLDEIKKFVGDDVILEVCAGKCYLAALLASIGVNIRATSIVDEKWYNEEEMQQAWYSCELIDCVDAINKYKPKYMLLSWGYNCIEACIEAFYRNNGIGIIVIGTLDGYTDCLLNFEYGPGITTSNMHNKYKNLEVYPYKCIKVVPCTNIPLLNIFDYVYFYHPLNIDETKKMKDAVIKHSDEKTKYINAVELLKKSDPLTDILTQTRDYKLAENAMKKYRTKFSFSIPTLSVLLKIKEFAGDDLILEVCAGKCYWASLLNSIGAKIQATSIIDIWYNAEQMKNTWYPCEIIDCVEAINKYKPKCLMLSWGFKCLDRCMKAFFDNDGEKIIIISTRDGETDSLYDVKNTQGSVVRNAKFTGTYTYYYPYKRIAEYPNPPITIGKVNDSVCFYKALTFKEMTEAIQNLKQV